MKIKSKFCVQIIFSYLKIEKTLDIVKYNKNIQKIIDVSKYDYLSLLIERYYLNIYNEPILYLYLGNDLKNNEVSQKCNNIIKKISHDYSKSYSLNIEKDKGNILIINRPIELTTIRNVYNYLNHLIITNMISINIPVGILMNLQSLYLKKINNIIFEEYDEKKNIILNHLEDLQLSSIYIKSTNKVKFLFPNLKKLKLKIKNVFSFSFLERNFGFNFAYNFFKKNYINFNENKNYKNIIQKDLFEDESFPKNLLSFCIKSKNSQYLSSKNRIYEDIDIRFERLFNNKIKYRYLIDVHSETKNMILREIRFSNNSYNNYSHKIKNLSLFSEEECKYDFININDLNSFEFSPKEHYLYGIDVDNNENKELTGKDFIMIFKSINTDNYNLNYLKFSYIDVNVYPDFVDKIKYLKMLIKFESDNFYIKKELLFKLFKNFSKLKLISLIVINVQKMKLNEKEKNTIKNYINFIGFESKKNNILISGELKYKNKVITKNEDIIIDYNKIKMKDNIEKEEDDISFINNNSEFAEEEEEDFMYENDLISEDLIISVSNDSWDEKKENISILENVSYDNFFTSNIRAPIKRESLNINTIVINIFKSLFKSNYKTKLFSNPKNYKENPILNALINNSPLPKKKKKEKNCDDVFYEYLFIFKKKTNQKYFALMIKIIIILREFINIKVNENIPNDEDKKDFTGCNNPCDIPNLCNDYYSFLENNNFFGIEKQEEIIEIILHFNSWLFNKNYSMYKVSLENC